MVSVKQVTDLEQLSGEDRVSNEMRHNIRGIVFWDVLIDWNKTLCMTCYNS